MDGNGKCICAGNWRLLVAEYGDRIGQPVTFAGKPCHFIGLIWGEDDLYYGLREDETGKLHCLSCVGSLDGWLDAFKGAPKAAA